MEKLKYDHMGERNPDLTYNKPFSKETLAKIKQALAKNASAPLSPEEKTKDSHSSKVNPETPTDKATSRS